MRPNTRYFLRRIIEFPKEGSVSFLSASMVWAKISILKYQWFHLNLQYMKPLEICHSCVLEKGM